jgi:sulfite exporter TauE/SafE
LLVVLIVQPVIGFVHHRVFKKVQKRQVWSYVHLTLGRVGISLGIINGGLGLYLSGATAYHKRVYGIVAGIMWALWMGVAVWSEVRRLRKKPQATEEAASKGPTGSRRGSQEYRSVSQEHRSVSQE